MSPPQDAAPPKPKPPFPWVSAAIILACLAVFGLEQMLISLGKGGDQRVLQDEVMVRLGGAWVPAIRGGEWWRLVTYAFVHAGLIHIGSNLLAVWFLGIPIERRIGSVHFAQVSLVTALGASGLVIAVQGERALLVGVSGVVFGWAGAIIPQLNREGLRAFGRMLLINLFISLLPGVSLLGHLGGLVFGLACGLLLRYQPRRFSMLVPILAAMAALLGILGARHATG